MNKWLNDCEELNVELDKFIDGLVDLEDGLIEKSKRILDKIHSYQISVEMIDHPENDEHFYDYSDEEAENMYDSWERLYKLERELKAYERCFENVLHAFGSVM